MRPHLRRLALAASLVLVAAVIGSLLFLRLRRSVERALDTPRQNVRPLQFVPLAARPGTTARWGTSAITGVALAPTGLWTAGDSGVAGDGPRDETSALPTLRASALTLWRGRPVLALRAGGLFRRGDLGWEEARSGFGTLEVRALLETEGGELLVGARQGLFRAAFGAASLERLDAHPVRALSAGPGFVLAGGEEGLFRLEPGRVRTIETPDPWIESVELDGRALWVVTALGLAQGTVDGTLVPVAAGEDVASGVVHEGVFVALGEPPTPILRRLDGHGHAAEERLPGPARRLFTSRGVLFADLEDGLYRRDGGSFRLVRRHAPALPGRSAHVSALALLGSQLVAGLFDGGLAVAEPRGDAWEWHVVPGSPAWGVNALLPAGGVLYVASLRGAARFDGRRLEPIEGPGAAFSLAPTPSGIAIGYGQGVLVPGVGLLSAFHGLPGNQALALLSGPALYVGTPSGLGAIEGRRVRWGVAPGEGKLPHAWVTALGLSGDTLYVGTYGGGVVRRVGPAGSSAARFEPFPETEGLKVNAGALVEAGGRLYLGTDGDGLFRLTRDGRRFEKVRAALPSPRVTALAAGPATLFVGTDEGLARLTLDDGDNPEGLEP